MDLLPPAESRAAAVRADVSPEIGLDVGLEAVHPALWRASQVGRACTSAFASSFEALDAVLPGGGWPAGVLTELLLPHPGVGEMRLLAPVLAQQQARGLMWFDPPALPCAAALRMLGLELDQLVLVRSRPAAAARAKLASSASAPDALWALEHALKSGQVGAVLAWLPSKLPADALRRLQLAAQGHEGPVFLLRPEEAAVQPSAAPLRLLLGCAAPDWLRVTLLKRRGPPVAHPLVLALAPVLSAPKRARAEAGAAALQRAAASLIGPHDPSGEDQWA
jgi:protein ImuA